LARPKSRDRAHDTAPAAPARRIRIPWVAVGLTIALFVTAAFAVSPIRDAATFGTVDEMRLAGSGAYLVMAPISTTLDAITLLTVGQHISVMLWAIGIFAVIRVWRARRRTTSLTREAIAAVLLLLGIFVVYAAVAFLPRPMAHLVSSDGNVLVADFHSHTKYSHDGRAGWTEDDVRRWYRGAGFDVAYITDHRTFEGAERGVASNASQAGEGTMLFQGLEAFYKGEHVNVLSAGRRFLGLTNDALTEVDPEALALTSMIPATAPTLIETVPGKLDQVPHIAATDTSAGVTAIEIVDGAPRGLSQTRGERARIIHLADSLDLALVTGSDNHGYGYAAAGWTLLRIPGWRGMRTDSLSSRIEQVLRIGRREATRVVERRPAPANNAFQIALAAPLVLWNLFVTLSADERVTWLLWIWGFVLLRAILRRARLQPSATT
jgi:hypothetical protein